MQVILCENFAPSMPFRFDGLLFFLTYPQSDLTPNAVHEHINGLKAIKWLRVCRESHANGQPHLHAVGSFVSRFQSRNERVFDIQGRHPNIQSVRSVKHALEYVAKDGEFTDFGTIPTVGSTKRSARELYEAASSLPESEYWLQAAESGVNFQYAKRFRELQWRCQDIDIPVDYQGDLSWESTFLQNLAASERNTVLVGPTGHGKTSWAKRVVAKPALFISQIEDLRKFVPGHHKGIVFDDMCFDHTPVTSQIHLLDWDMPRSIYCRYSNAIIPANTMKIFTCNRFPFTMGNAAIMRRIHLLKDLDFPEL